jgi:hypothetical protein
MPRFIGPTIVAEQLEVDPATVRRWVKQGLIPGAFITPTGRVRLPSTIADDVIRNALESSPKNGRGDMRTPPNHASAAHRRGVR